MALRCKIIFYISVDIFYFLEEAINQDVTIQGDEESDEEQETGTDSNGQKEAPVNTETPGEDSSGGNVLQNLTSGVIDSFSFLRTRVGRAAEVFNYLRGLQLQLSSEGWYLVKGEGDI